MSVIYGTLIKANVWHNDVKNTAIKTFSALIVCCFTF